MHLDANGFKGAIQLEKSNLFFYETGKAFYVEYIGKSDKFKELGLDNQNQIFYPLDFDKSEIRNFIKMNFPKK